MKKLLLALFVAFSAISQANATIVIYTDGKGDCGYRDISVGKNGNGNVNLSCQNPGYCDCWMEEGCEESPFTTDEQNAHLAVIQAQIEEAILGGIKGGEFDSPMGPVKWTALDKGFKCEIN